MGIRWRQPAARRTGFTAAAVLLSAATLAVAGTTTAALGAVRTAGLVKPAASASYTPQLRLIAAQKEIEVGKYGKGPVYFDPGIWLASFRSAFQLNVSRAGYRSPETAEQVIRTPGGTLTRPVPSALLDGWSGLRHFLYVTIRTTKGQFITGRGLPFCPDSYELAKATVASANTSPYPQQCAGGDPFALGEVWGLSRGWAADAYGYQGYRLLAGNTYRFTETIGARYAGLFGISPRDATVTVKVKVVPGSQCKQQCQFGRTAALPAQFTRGQHPARSSPQTGTSRSRLPAARILTQAPRNAEPDLIPTPAWQISVSNTKAKESYVDFASTVWIGGNAPLDVEGFRVPGTGRMTAYQYFYRNGKAIGRMRAGTMGFARYNAWHFQQFAQYLLLNSRKHVVVRSRKVGFCIAPTDSVDMLLRHATWQPSYTGIFGNCGNPSALWVQEQLPLGWGDTYVQTVPYQSFEVTDLPDGTYYIEIVANPEHLLHETSTTNDVSLRKIIISGKAGHRRVRVPAWNGIDPEHAA